MIGKIFGFRREGEQARRIARQDPAAYLAGLGLAERPFREARHDFLLSRSESSGGALEKLLEGCRRGGDVMLATAGVAEIQHPLGVLLARSLGAEFLVVNIQADLLMGADEVLDRVSESLSLATGQAHAPRGMIAGFREFLSTQNELNALVVQIENAHELGADVIDALLELAADPAGGGVLRLLLWGESYLWESLAYLLAERGLRGSHVEIAPFTCEDVSDYLEYCLVEAGYGGDFPFSETQVERILRESQSAPHMIDSLADDELEALAASAGRGRRAAFPLPHALAAGVLLAALGTLYAGQGIDFSSGAGAGEGARSGGTIIVPIDTRLSGPAGSLSLAAETPVTEEAAPESAQEGGAQPALSLREDSPPRPASPEPAAPDPEPAPAPAQAGEPPVQVAQAETAPRELTPLERSQSRLRALPPEHYFLQLMGTFSEQSARDFIAGNGGGDKFYYFKSEYQNRPWFVVVYGSFASRQQAASALEALPAELRKTSPWVRSGEEIRLAMAKR